MSEQDETTEGAEEIEDTEGHLRKDPRNRSVSGDADDTEGHLRH